MRQSMKALVVVSGLVTAALWLVGGGGAERVHAEARESRDVIEVRELIEQLVRASFEQDADAMVEFFHPELIMAHPGGPVIRGRDSVESAMRATVARYSKRLLVDVVEIETYGDRGHVMVESWHDITDVRTQERTFKPVRAMILVRRNEAGKWQIYLDFDHVPDDAFIERYVRYE
jgi:uncharacterized protein (TIGR02246 family)